MEYDPPSPDAANGGGQPTGEDNARYQVWLIYQGKRGEELCQTLLPALEGLADFQFNRSAYNNQTAAGSIYGNVMLDLARCDFAVAVVTKDERPAWSAGNAWFEIGLWMGRRDPSRLVVCLEMSDEPVSLISDLSGVAAPRFSGVDDLRAHVTEFLHTCSTRHVPALTHENERRRRVQDVFGAPDAAWLRPESYECRLRDATVPCEFKQSSLEFAAELMRMGRASHERDAVAHGLMRIGHLSMHVLDLWKAEPRTPSLDAVRQDMMGIAESLHLLFQTADELLMNGGRRYPDPFSVDARLSAFLEHRLRFAVDLGSELPAFRVSSWQVKHYAKLEASDFVDWARQFEKRYIQDRPAPDERARLRDQLAEWGRDYCLRVAEILEMLGCWLFSKGRKAIKSTLPTEPHPDRVDAAFEAVVRSLPHNVSPRVAPRIWPDTRGNSR